MSTCHWGLPNVKKLSLKSLQFHWQVKAQAEQARSRPLRRKGSPSWSYNGKPWKPMDGLRKDSTGQPTKRR